MITGVGMQVCGLILTTTEERKGKGKEGRGGEGRGREGMGHMRGLILPTINLINACKYSMKLFC